MKTLRRLAVGGSAHVKTANSTKIWWIEKLLQTPIEDYRKFAVWRILAPYLINIRKYSTEEASGTLKNWLDRCEPVKAIRL